MGKFDKKLATILVKHGVVAEEQRESVLAAADQEKKSLTEYLVEQKVAAEPDIIGAVSMEMNLPPIDIEKLEIDPEALDLVPEDIARHYQVLPVAKIGKTLTLAVANPLDLLIQDDVNVVTGCNLMPVVSTDVSIKRAIDKAYGNGADGADGAAMQEIVSEMGIEDDLELGLEVEGAADAEVDEVDSAPVVKLANLIIAEGVKAQASGIHIEPYEHRTRVRFRIDGACVEKMSPPKKYHGPLVSRIKIIADMNITESRNAQDGKFKMKFKGRNVDFRVSILPLVYGEKVVMRILDAATAMVDVDSLGFEGKSYDDFSEAIKASNGMVLVTGPTGSGKTTTLYAALRKIVCVEDNITSVEDPVEYTMDGINQVQVNERRGLTFAGALRSILRQDPDVVFIGEIRDVETAEIAIKAALTGHLVFSTLHTNDAVGTVTRLLNMGIDGFLVSSTLILVVAQQLVRRLCPECRETYKATEEQMREWGFTDDEIAAKPDLFKAVGCSRCNDLGYKGRLALLETLKISREIREVIVGDASVVDIKRTALKDGMLTLRRVGILNALRANTAMQEVLSSTMPDR